MPVQAARRQENRSMYRAAPLLLACLPALLAGGEEPRPITFDRKDLGKLPAGWKAAQTGEGKGSV
jgi:hypothetical protein